MLELPEKQQIALLTIVRKFNFSPSSSLSRFKELLPIEPGVEEYLCIIDACRRNVKYNDIMKKFIRRKEITIGMIKNAVR
mmetsp:Transcript_14428/g.18860  ORF Transcript_14428/g.18860 Transcript_14428/m.18860 type:complete len:80 (-) Transcript_14428:889-1128(-)